jgi:hypothetical protein
VSADGPRTVRNISFSAQSSAHGTRWLVHSYAMFAKARPQWAMLLLTYYMVLVAADLVPFVGGFLAFILKPVLAVGFLAAAWTQERGEKPVLSLLFRGFRSNLPALALLGVVFVVGMNAAMRATALIDDGKLFALIANAGPQDVDQDAAARRLSETLGDPRVQLGMIVGALCAIPTLFALWWAPALVVFQDASATSALITSFRAAVANWKSILRYALAVFVFGGLLPTLVGTLIAVLLPAPFGPALAFTLMLLYSVFFVATLHISDYVSYRDVFHAEEPLQIPAAAPES